jgi:hypothetical protein
VSANPIVGPEEDRMKYRTPLILVALTCAAAVSPFAVGSSHAAAAGNCPAHALCLFPEANYQGEPAVLTIPQHWSAKSTRLDDAPCMHHHIGSVIDNTKYGVTVFGNDQCDDGGDSQDIAGGGKVGKFSDWHARSVVFPLVYPVD